MKITYIHHSAFSVELDDKVLLFDYFNKELPHWNPDCRLYVFASHKHFDHYSRKIFDLVQQYPNIQFILAKEIRMTQSYMDRWNIPMEARERMHFVQKNAEYDFEELHVTTLTSTDSGVAFIVRTGGKTIYHAGDLHWWAWKPEIAPEYEMSDEKAKRMEENFKREVDKYDRSFHVDAAFLPLDIRLEDNFYKGFDYYMRRWDIEKAFPMHCWGRFDAIDKLKAMELTREYRDRIADITKDGEVFVV